MTLTPNKLFIFGMLLLSALAMPFAQAADDIKGVNLLHTANWRAATDDFGSSFKASNPLVQNEEIAVEFTMSAKQEGKRWPFVELVCATETALTGVSNLEITYRSESDVSVKFSQSDFGSKGDGSYAHYQTVIPASDEWVTIKLQASEFKQPSWAPESTKKIALNLSNVEDIYLSPKLNFETGETSTLRIKSLRVL
ncbi:hypothetical protein ATN88_20105 [Enterovibrio coralii]|uniref:NADH:ubiquinone oxidoreductase intermediate-associated protein 30 domain-containing protein n=2 Tax=Enterovibrio coralii TaxID=294935 RepID=A0A135I9P9_9GAMM|nr:hypothetical protein ATN88_20105 [Enterovibrio coralii]